MAKAIPKISSRRNGRISSRKGARRIPEGVIHVKASFNNTIVTATMYGLSSFWSSPVLRIQRYEKRNTICCSNRRANAIRM
ncbi:hypothetical protein H5410_064199 [Solanum commersonii]|uniref:30S ribosomal protein S11, chloroplastic n=1 Tax=Solanum commersonii TaxID=4109 RepID=A0A9J5VZZ5_SOLCO|nr:hypothetical protein H5410_064199 [Solanum commersonii]